MIHTKSVTDLHAKTINFSVEKLQDISDKFNSALKTVLSVTHENDTASQLISKSSNIVTDFISNVVSVTEENSASISQISSSVSEIAAQSISILKTANDLQLLSQSLRSSVFRFHIPDEY